MSIEWGGLDSGSIMRPAALATVGRVARARLKGHTRRVPCLRDERTIGFVALGIGIVLAILAALVRKRRPFEIPGLPFVGGWTFLLCCTFSFAVYFLATGFGLIPPGALAGCD